MAKEAASEQSQSTAAAISSGVPSRPMGSSAIRASRPPGVLSAKRWIISVSMMPGQTALTRTWDAA